MKLRRLKMRRSTRGTLAGLLIAVGSLYLLSVSYDIPRSTLLYFLAGSVLLVLAMIAAAVAAVFIFRMLALAWRKLMARRDDDS